MVVHTGRTTDGLFTERRVYVRLADLLPVFEPQQVRYLRYSLDDEEGIMTQERSTLAIAADDPDVMAYFEIPTETWDTARTDLAAKHRVTWLHLDDIHPNATGRDVVAAVVPRGETLFVRVTSSATKREIPFADRDDRNAYTELMGALARHYVTTPLWNWAEQASRAGRNGASFSETIDILALRGQMMIFGGRLADPSDPNDQTLLAVMGAMGANNTRDLKMQLTGKWLTKMWAGGMPKSENQLPQGLAHKRSDNGRRIREHAKGYIPVWDEAFIPHLQQLVRMAIATDEFGGWEHTYADIGRRLAELEADDHITRRGQKASSRTYQELVATGASQALSDAGKSLFILNGVNPRQDEDLYLGKVRLWRSGVYFTRRRNDIEGRGTRVDGRAPSFDGPTDFEGCWEVETAIPWPVIDGVELVGLGLDPTIWDRLEARLLAERDTRRPTGGAAHHREDCRVLDSKVFGTWQLDDLTQMTAYPRRGNRRADGSPGTDTSVLLSRPLAVATRDGKPRGWVDWNKAEHVLATFRSREMAASVAHALTTAVAEGLLDPESVVPMRLRAVRDDGQARARRSRALGEIQQLREDAAAKRVGIAGMPQAIGTVAAAGLDDQVMQLTESMGQLTSAADAMEARARLLETELSEAESSEAQASQGESEQDAELSQIAYLTASLRRASKNNGRGPATLNRVAADVLTGWKLIPIVKSDGDDRIEWSCIARLPLVGGGHAELPLAGWISSVRNATGGALLAPSVLARETLFEGRELDGLAELHGHRRSALVRDRLMPWLVTQGLTRRAAKCALIDHPFACAKRVLYMHLTGQDEGTVAVGNAAWRDHLLATYTDPQLDYGLAACPMDLVLAHRIAATLAKLSEPSQGASIADLALAADVDRDVVEQLVAPAPRLNGFRQPKFFERVPSDPTAIRLRACPHRHSPSCRGYASHVVVLPETVAGHGVVCPDCRLMPAVELASVHVPTAYLQSISGSSSGSLRKAGLTHVLVDPPAALDVAASTSVTTAQISRALGVPASRARQLLNQLNVRGHLPGGSRPGHLRYPRSSIEQIRAHLETA